MLKRKKVLILDSSKFDRQQLKTTIQTHETLVDIIQAETIDQATDVLINQQPDIVFLDIMDPPRHSLAFIALIKDTVEQVRIVVITHNDSPDIRTAALENGADRFFAKQHDSSVALVDLIHDIVRRS